MLLRRVTKHVKDQNWFAVGIDFFIVVIGVFIGIQVANWNDARSEAQRGELLEERLIAEFLRIEAYIDDNIRKVEGWQTVSERVSNEVLSGELIGFEDNSTARLNEVTGWIQPPGTSATYNEIVSQGDMDLLTSPVLRAALIDYKIVAERHLDANLVLIQAIQKDMNLVNRIRSLALVPADERPDRFAEALQSELASPDLYVGISNIMRARRLDLAWHRGALNDACEVLQALGQPCAHSANIDVEEKIP